LALNFSHPSLRLHLLFNFAVFKFEFISSLLIISYSLKYLIKILNLFGFENSRGGVLQSGEGFLGKEGVKIVEKAIAT